MRLLIVDDDPKLRGTIRRGLHESNIDCADAACVDDALEFMQREGDSIDLVLLDVMMPERPGWEFLSELRERGDKTPVIFLTARSAVDERVRGLQLGADDYIIKPFAFSELLARIAAVARRHQGAPIFELQGLKIDFVHRTVDLDGARIELSPREFEMLQAFAESGGRVLPRSEILSRVWGIDFDPGTNVVDVLVARLRRKIGRDGRPFIETVKGEGYRMMVEGAPA